MRICGRCKIEKPLTEFYKDKRNKDGLTTICKKCIRVDAKRYKQSEKGKLSTKRYKRGEAGRESTKRYKRGEAGKKASKRYCQGEAGKLSAKRNQKSEARKKYVSTEKFKNRNKLYLKKRNATRRLQVLIHYSEETPRCKKCGEKHLEFLEIDHINGGGRKQRGTGWHNIYVKLIAENFPEGYQILCSNCNIKKFKMFKKSQFVNRTIRQKSAKKSNDKVMMDVFSHYMTDGKIKCSCPGCNVDDIDVLCIDHINGDGAEHRKNNGLKGGSDMYRWIRKNGYPDDLRLLCHKCNQALHNYGYCPHEREVENGTNKS
jgi:hypothetical protein